MPSEGPFHALPPLYAGWAKDLLGGPIPAETEATCHDCAMCIKPDGTLPTSIYFFDPALKCCVYMPELPSFLAGRILADEDPAGAIGRATLRARIEKRIAVTPLGVGRPPSYDLLFRNSASTLGRSRTLRCPHFVEEGGTCGIWKHRDAMCTTWFCRFVRGQVGADFWKALRELLVIVEGTLARHAALELGVDVEVLSRWIPRERQTALAQVPEGRELDGEVEDAAYAAMWGEWAGKEEAFYRAAAARVEGLRFDEVLAIGGPEMAILAGVAKRAYARLGSDLVPLRLRVGSFQIASQRDGGVRAVTHSHLDAIDLPSALLTVLPAFDGRPTEEVLHELAARGVGFEAGYLRKLCDYGILVPA
ncbi:MAG: hypothetical protein U0359_24310 [Byssovorax sp.]